MQSSIKMSADWFPRETHGMLVQLRMTCNGFVRGHERPGCLTPVETFEPDFMAQKCR